LSCKQFERTVNRVKAREIVTLRLQIGDVPRLLEVPLVKQCNHLLLSGLFHDALTIKQAARKDLVAQVI
jgi:hypothetical protein